MLFNHGASEEETALLVLCFLANETWCELPLQDWKDKLGKDPQKRADPKVFQHSELRELFGAYVHNLRGQIQQGYRSLMEQASQQLNAVAVLSKASTSHVCQLLL